MGSTKDVLDCHLRSFGGHDLKGILSDYAPGAVLFTPEGPLRGVDAIKAFFQALLAEFGKPGATFRLKHQSVEGDYGYILKDGRDCRQRVRIRYRYVRRAGWQDRGSIIRGQDHAQAVKTRVRSRLRPRSR
jgi:ketosteroid isomerase-like protein